MSSNWNMISSNFLHCIVFHPAKEAVLSWRHVYCLLFWKLVIYIRNDLFCPILIKMWCLLLFISLFSQENSPTGSVPFMNASYRVWAFYVWIWHDDALIRVLHSCDITSSSALNTCSDPCSLELVLFCQYVLGNS